ncbi:MAG: sulfatase-like hydrolase/transferase [Chitinophagaceae bacterium]|nr:sulfatase-like hydrolase/transferase [Chitinophagaceae bacterium]
MKIFHFPYYICLVPLFFVLHACTVHWLYIEVPVLLLLAGKYMLAAALAFLFFYLLIKNRDKAACITFAILFIHFFFPEVHILIRKHSPWPFPGRYIFIIPLLVALVIFLFIRIRKSPRSYTGITRYLNILLLILVIADLSVLVFRKINSSARNLSLANSDIAISPCMDCPKPDIYFLVFDEYSSSASLKEDYGYDNQFLDSFLLKNGFKIQPESRSNYNSTAFSAASITNMSYLDIADTAAVTSIDYAHAARLVGNSRLFSIMETMGYDILNISLFDIKGSKAPVKFYHGKDVQEIIMSRTFTSRLLSEAGWNFLKKQQLRHISTLQSKGIQTIRMGIDTLKKISAEKGRSPRFIYSHLLMPHPPFLMNKAGPRTPEKVAATPDSSVKEYLDYVFYTNTVIKEIITAIQDNTGGSSVIVIMSDHGFRHPAKATISTDLHFKIQNALYFPSGNYSRVYDSISGVNQFRVVLNTLFRQNISLLPDQQFFLQARK